MLITVRLGLPVSAPAYATPVSSRQLPSFADFQHKIDGLPRAADVENADIASITTKLSNLSCSACAALKPVLKQAANELAELHATRVCTECIRDQHLDVAADVAQIVNFPSDDDPVSAVKWIIERVRYAKDYWTTHGSSTCSACDVAQRISSSSRARGWSPPNTLNSKAAQNADGFRVPKRPRSGSLSDGSADITLSLVSHSNELAGGTEQRSDSRDSARPLVSQLGPNLSRVATAESPMASKHSPRRTMPSPSPSLSRQPQINRLPTPSSALQQRFPNGPSVLGHSPHSSLTNSVDSQAADLHNQITLKSQALQSVQSECVAIGQKYQRECIRTQALEQRSAIADGELGELTGRNEELEERIRTLESQFEDMRRKQVDERAQNAREKEQWGRMLEMSGRLHAKNAEDRQRLVEENHALTLRVTAYEEENTARIDRVRESTLSGPGGRKAQVRQSEASENMAGLKQEVHQLNSRVETLCSALAEVKRHTEETAERTRDFMNDTSSITNTIDRAFRALQSSAVDSGTMDERMHGA